MTFMTDLEKVKIFTTFKNIDLTILL